jgi:hypothetical protein
MSTIRDSKKLQVWEERLREFRSGQHTVRQFCERLGISQANFYYWKRKLPAHGSKRKQPKSRTSSFLPVFVKPTNRSGPCLSIQLPTGVRIRVPIEVSSSGNQVA